jgi:hypothetical protein
MLANPAPTSGGFFFHNKLEKFSLWMHVAISKAHGTLLFSGQGLPTFEMPNQCVDADWYPNKYRYYTYQQRHEPVPSPSKA